MAVYRNYYRPGGTDVALADGGTGASLTDPNADRIMFWDDSAGAVTWLTPGTGLTITATTIDASAASVEYPWMLDVDMIAQAAARTGWYTDHTGATHDGNVIGGTQFGGTAQNDSVEWDVVLAAGTWSIYFNCATYIDCGIITVTLDGNSVGTIDTYSGSPQYNQQKSLTGISVASTGKKRLKFTVSSKNASSTGYLIRGTAAVALRLIRTA